MTAVTGGCETLVLAKEGQDDIALTDRRMIIDRQLATGSHIQHKPDGITESPGAVSENNDNKSVVY